MYFRAFFRCRAIRSQNVWKVIAYWLMKWGLLLFRQQSSHLQIVPQRGFKYARFLAGNTNKALCFAATLVVLDALDAMTCAMEEATGYILWKLWKTGASKANCAQTERLRLRTVEKTQQHVFWKIGRMFMEQLKDFSVTILKLSEGFLYVTFNGT